MGEQLSLEQKQLYRRVDEILHYLWDPIGVSGVPQARDEYHSYLPRVFSLLIRHAPEAEIISFLERTATKTMGLSDTPAGLKHTARIVSILTDSRDVLLKTTVA